MSDKDLSGHLIKKEAIKNEREYQLDLLEEAISLGKEKKTIILLIIIFV